jgi:hypothetical protein
MDKQWQKPRYPVFQQGCCQNATWRFSRIGLSALHRKPGSTASRDQGTEVLLQFNSRAMCTEARVVAIKATEACEAPADGFGVPAELFSALRNRD